MKLGIFVNLRELQAIRQSLQLRAAEPPWWTASRLGTMLGFKWRSRMAVALAIAMLWSICAPAMARWYLKAHELPPRGFAWSQIEHGIWIGLKVPAWEGLVIGITGRVLHGRLAMCLPIPTVQNGEEVDQQSDLRIAKCNRRRESFWLIDLRGLAERFALH